MQNKTRQILIHALASIGFLCLPVLFSPDLTNPAGFFHLMGFQKDFVAFVLLYLFFYLNYLLLLPELFFRKKYFQYTVFIVTSFALILIVPQQIAGYNRSFTFPNDQAVVSGSLSHFNAYKRFFLHDLNTRLFQFLLVFTFSLLLKINIRLKQTEKEKLNVEISYLKAQINPHFLFNTLNSIYSLAISKSDETATAIVKLSGMMRYAITEANHESVSLEKELNYISNYIELQKLRLEDTVKVEFNLKGNTLGKQIAPLILIPFVENAFKHGVNPEENSRIEITISINATGVNLQVHNNKVNNVHDEKTRSGLGIENAQARLKLVYPAKHLLVIDNNKKQFVVDLTIDLT